MAASLLNRLTRSVSFGVVVLVAPMLSGLATGQQVNSYSDTRISQFERSVKELQGKLEQLRQQNQHLQQELARVQSSYDNRLQHLERGAAKTPPNKQPPPTGHR
jgi:TolA-binding protein